MKFVLDTNVVLKALIKDSMVRGILLGSTHEFLIPDHAIDETKKHLDVVAKKSGLTQSEINAVIETLLKNIQVIPADKSSRNGMKLRRSWRR